MRILHVEAGRHLYGGARQVMLLIEGLAAGGVDNVLLCPRGSAIAAQQVHARVLTCAMGGDADIGLFGRIRGVIAEVGPDLVHVHSRRGADWFGVLAARTRGVPVVLSRRVDNPESRWPGAVKYALADRVIAISQAVRDVLLAAGVAPAKVACVRSAVPPTVYEPRDRDWIAAQFGIPPDAALIGVIAQLIDRKGHRFLLEALPDIVRRHRDAQCLFLGRGPLEAQLRARAAALELGGVVRFAGFRDDLPRILPNLDLVVHPALREGLGVALLQAAQAGLAVVASDTGGLREAVADARTGLLVPPGDATALAGAVIALLDDPAQREALGAAGARRVAAEFTPRRMVAGNLAVYHDVLDGVGDGSRPR